MIDEGNPKSNASVTLSHIDAHRAGISPVTSRAKLPKARQGRPAAKAGPNGREQLLERTREALRAKPKADLQRQEIAAFAGVTPALVSYYFPDKWDLIEASAATIIDTYFEAVQNITTRSEPGIDELRDLFRLYVSFSMDNGHTLEFFLQNITSWKGSGRLEKTVTVYSSLICLLRNLTTSGVIRPIDPALLNSIIWSSAHYLAQQYVSRPSSFIDGSTYTADSIAESVLQIFLHGLRVPENSV